MSHVRSFYSTLFELTANGAAFLPNLLRSKTSLAAENLFLRKQLAFYQEREIRPKRPDDATRVTLVFLSRLFEWRQALVLVKPQTLIRWHRRGFRLLWKWKSRPRGRERLPSHLQNLIREMAESNVTWGEERIANELLLKLAIQVSPRTVRKYMPPRRSQPSNPGSQNWATFVRNHAKQLVACDFFTVVTATFRVFYVLVVVELGSRKLLHTNVTRYPTAEWTLMQLREAIPCEHNYRFLIHDRDSILSKDLDQRISNLGIRVLKTPYQAPRANTYCERLVGTTRRECLDFFIPFGERHLRHILRDWEMYYNRRRPHSSLGPGLPEPDNEIAPPPGPNRHSLPEGYRVSWIPVLGGLHHDYRLEKLAA